MAVAGHIVANLTANTQGWVSGFKAAESPLASFESKLGRFMTLVAGAFGFQKLIQSASDLQETQSKFDTVFGNNAESARAWGNEYAKQVGRSRRQVESFLSESQDLFVPIGFDESTATQLSQSLTMLTTDLASFNNQADQDVFRNLISGIMGESEPLKKFGVIVNEAAVKQELFNQGLDPNKVSDQQKMLARMNIIIRSTTAAQGDAIRTSDGWANSWKRFTAQVDNLSAEFGKRWLPIMAQGLSLVTNLFEQWGPYAIAAAGWMSDLVQQNSDWIPVLGGTAIAILGVVGVMKVVTVATMAYAKAQILVSALAGPKAWLAIGAGLAVAAVASSYLSDTMTNLSNEVATSIEAHKQAEFALAKAGSSMNSGATQAKSYANEVASMRKEYDSFLPKSTELSVKLRKIESDWFAAAAAGEQGILTFSQMKGLQLKTLFSESGFTGMFDDLTSQLRVLRGEIDETGLKFEQMAAMGVDERHINVLRQMTEEQKRLTKAKEAADQLKEDRKQKLETIRGNIDQFQQSKQSTFGAFKSTVDDVRDAIDAGIVQPIEAFRFLEDQRKQMVKDSVTTEGKQASNTAVDSRSEQGNQMVVDLLNRRTDKTAEQERQELEKQSLEVLKDIRAAAVANGMKTKPFNQRGSGPTNG